jgi:signal transduction histidine kinase/DNA-binding response OmpR family regulator
MMPVDEKTKILIVDDMPDKLLVYRTILDELNLNLITVPSGEEALRAVLNHDFAAILLDVNMPGMNGFETAALIRGRKRSAHVPIIFLTAFADEVRAEEGYAHGAVDYITTPIIPTVLVAKIRVFADLHRMTQQVRRQAEERIALIEERTRRAAAEEANRWLDFLTRAGACLWQSLDQRVTMHSVVRLPVPMLADVVALVMPEPEETTIDKCIRACRDSHGTSVEENVSIQSLDRDLAHAIERSWNDAAARQDTGRAVAFPLRARGSTFAVLGLARRASRSPFLPGELTVAETFTSRASSALENARLYREVQEADRQKNEFLSMLAHELRNPLAPIRNANELLKQKASDPTKVRWAQGVIERQVCHMVRLVDDLLDVSRLTLGKIRLSIEQISLNKVVAQAIEATQTLMDQFEHTLEVRLPSQPLYIVGDEARVTQILINLLNNAAKYTDSGGRISFEAAHEAGFVVMRVRDNGVGISAELLPKVFDLFTQASRSLDRSQGGLGVGLTLVRQLVEMQGGSVSASSEGLGCGSEFVVRLPAIIEGVESSSNDGFNLSDAQQNGGPLRMVVVDDNKDAAESLTKLLELLGHEAVVANDGPTGIAVVNEFHPDVVFLDIGLPGMDGYEVARRIRAEIGRGPMLIAVSGYGREEDRQLAFESGFDHHFVKPVRLDAIRPILETIRVISS